MEVKPRKRKAAPRKRKAAIRDFFAAVDRLIAASKQAELARDKLLSENRAEEEAAPCQP